MRIVQRSILPDGAQHEATVAEARSGGGMLRRSVLLAVDHYLTHRHPRGGYVGVAPTEDGIVVQLHAPDGRIESWRELVVAEEQA